MRKVLITMMAIAFSLSAWSTEVIEIEQVQVGELEKFNHAFLTFLCIDGYKYIRYEANKPLEGGSITQMFKVEGRNISLPIECSMD